MAEPSTSPPAKLDENHRRSISITLQLVDKALCEWDNWAKGQVQSGVMYRQQDTFSPAQKSELGAKIAKIRQLMVQLRDDLQLQTRVVATAQSMVGQAALLWELLIEMDSRSLQGYGKVPDELAHYLNPIANQLGTEMNKISRLFSRPTSTVS
jgi:hypothetical protein